MEGPRVSGPWLGVWGGNANALPRPNSYKQVFYFFLIPCETMSPRKLTFAARVAASESLDPSAKRRSREPESTRS